MEDIRINNGKNILFTQYHPEEKFAKETSKDEKRSLNIFKDFLEGENIIEKESALGKKIGENFEKIKSSLLFKEKGLYCFAPSGMSKAKLTEKLMFENYYR